VTVGRASITRGLRAVGPRSTASDDDAGGHSPTLRAVTDLDRRAWERFVDRHPDASIFHTPAMHRVFAETQRYRPMVWATVDDDGDVRALFTPVSMDLLAGTVAPLSRRTVAFANPLVGPGATRAAALEILLRAYTRDAPRLPLSTEVRNVVAMDAFTDTIAAAGFRHERHLNFLVDLASPEDVLWGRITDSARRNIKKARRVGVAIEERTDAAAIAEGYAILRAVYRRLGVPLPDRSLFDAAARILGPSGRFTMLLARLDEMPIGVLTLLSHRDVLTYWYTGTLRAHATARAGDLLVWHAIGFGHRTGLRTMDFGGAGRPDEPYGVRDFKAKYGGELVDHGRDLWEPARVRLRAATLGYALVRRFR
jgi:hypothetical protein